VGAPLLLRGEKNNFLTGVVTSFKVFAGNLSLFASYGRSANIFWIRLTRLYGTRALTQQRTTRATVDDRNKFRATG
jgi:hypothetical protein